MIGLEVDHRDMNSLNNRRNNLRIATKSQNSTHRKKQNGPYSSKYKGVSYYKRDNNWSAYICFDGRKSHIGYYDLEISAAISYNHQASMVYGEYAFLNEV